MVLKRETSRETNSHPIPQEAFDWYDEYAHGNLSRREFINRLGSLAVLGFSATALLEALTPNYALAEKVSFNDPDIKARYQTFPSPDGHGEGSGYLVMPQKKTIKSPAVLVVHENRGLNPYIKDVARRLAKDGFLAFAPDALYPIGGYPGNDDDGRTMQKSMDRAKIEQDFIAAANFLKQHERSTGKLGAVGFCFGGYIVNMLAAVMSDKLDAGVPFYGTPAEESLRKQVKGPLLLHFAALDKRVNDTWPNYEQQLIANDADYTALMYENVNHGFHNDSTGRYAPEEAALAWERTIAFFRRFLA